MIEVGGGPTPAGGATRFTTNDGEPIYVGQTNEQLRTRVRRHLTNQRTDAVAMRILDVFEVAELELWPVWEFEAVNRSQDPASFQRPETGSTRSSTPHICRRSRPAASKPF